MPVRNVGSEMPARLNTMKPRDSHELRCRPV